MLKNFTYFNDKIDFSMLSKVDIQGFNYKREHFIFIMFIHTLNPEISHTKCVSCQNGCLSEK